VNIFTDLDNPAYTLPPTSSLHRSDQDRSVAPKREGPDVARSLQGILDRLDREIRVLRLNFYKRVKFANPLKWRLIENGVEKAVADKVTHLLLLRLCNAPLITCLQVPSTVSVDTSTSWPEHVA
jgi:hypothetical protein